MSVPLSKGELLVNKYLCRLERKILTKKISSLARMYLIVNYY